MNWDVREVERTWSDFTYCHGDNLEGQKKNTIDVSQGSGSPGRDLNPGTTGF